MTNCARFGRNHRLHRVVPVSLSVALIAAFLLTGPPAQASIPTPTTTTTTFHSVCPVAGAPTMVTAAIGDGGPAVAASINQPISVAADGAGNAYVVESGRARVRRIDAVTGVITTVASNLNGPRSLAVDPTGTTLYIGEGFGADIRRLDLSTGTLTTIAGVLGQGRTSTDPLDGQGAGLKLSSVASMALDGSQLYFGDIGLGVVQVLDLTSGQVSHAAGDPTSVSYPSGLPAGTSVPATSMRLGPVTGLAVDSVGHRLFIADISSIEVVDLTTGLLSHFALSGVGLDQYPSGLSSLARTSNSLTLAWDGNSLQVADGRMNVIRSFNDLGATSRTSGDTIGGFADGTGTAHYALPLGLAVAPGGRLLVADTQNNAVRSVVIATDTVSTIGGAGPRTAGPIGASTLATSFDLGSISGMAVDDTGATYVASAFADRIYRIGTDQRITQFAGSGAVRPEYPVVYVDGEPGLSHPFARIGNLRFAVIGGHRWLYGVDLWDVGGGRRLIRIDLDDPAHRVYTVTGLDQIAVYPTDGAVAATTNYIYGISDYLIDERSGDVYVADGYAGTVWRIDATTGLLSRFAGSGNVPAAVPADGVPKLSADLGFVWAIAMGPDHTIYLGTQKYNREIYAVDSAGNLQRVAGLDNGSPSLSGDGGPARDAVISPNDMVVDGTGNLVLADSTVIRRVIMTSPTTSGNIESIVQGEVGEPDFAPVRGERSPTAAISGNANQLDFAPDGSLVWSDDFLNSGDDYLLSTMPTPGRIHMVRRATAGGCANAVAHTTGTVILSQSQPVNANNVPLDGIPPTSLTDAALDTFLSSTPLRSSGPGSTPLRSSSIASLPLRSSGAPRIGLQTVTFVDGRRWSDVLAGTVYNGVPAQDVTLNDVVALAASGSAPTLAAITLADLDLSASPLRSSSVAAIALGPTTLSQLPGHDPAEADPYVTTWCPYIVSVGLSCSDFSGASTLLDVEVKSAPLRSSPLRSSPLRSSPLRSSDLSSSPLRSSPLRSSNLAASPLRSSPLRSSALGTAAIGSIPLTSIPLRSSDLAASPLRSSPLRSSSSPAALNVVIDCARVDCSTTSTATLADAAGLVPTAIRSTATVADLFTAFPPAVTDSWVLGDLHEYGDATIGDIAPFLPATYTVADAILAVIPASALAWESVGADAIGLAGLGATPAVTMAVGFDLAPARDSSATAVVVTLPPEVSLVTSPAPVTPLVSIPLVGQPDVNVNLAPVVSGRTVTFAIPATVPGARRYELQLPVSATRPQTQTVAIAVLGTINGDQGLNVATTSVNVVDEPASPPPLEPTLADGDLYVGSISAPGDIDTVDVAVPSVPGAITDVTLSGADVDLDLTAYQPTIRPPISGRSYRANGLKTPPIESTDPELASFNQNLDPQVLRDIPVVGNDPSKVLAYSAQRGVTGEKLSLVSKAGDQGVYKIQVSGYGTASSSKNYLLVVRQHVPAGGGACPARVAAAPAASPTSPGAINAATRALFLVDESRMIETYGASAYNTMLAKLTATAARSEVAGAVIKVDGDPSVRAAYANWDAAPCDSDRANQVVGAIDSLVDQLQSSLPGTGAKAITSITVVGSDQIVPQARVADGTKDSNEFEYAADVQRVSASGAVAGPSPLSAALAARSILTDDAYVDWDPYAWRDGALFVPDIAVGRLVEKPSEIGVALQSYLDNVTSTTIAANLRGRLTAGSSLTTGYDFLTDGAQAVDSALANRITARQTLISNSWTRADLASSLYPAGSSPEVDSLNGHYDHHEALPAAGNTTGDTSDLFTTADVYSRPGRLRGRIIFSMGCHSGLSVPDGYLTGSVTDTDAAANPAALPGESAAQTAARAGRLDWAEAYANDGAVYVGNTGYGYGDSSTVAFSERLMSQFAADLDGTVSVGQALVRAKNDYYRGAQLAFSDYDHKVLQESTFYGLPFWGVGAPATAPAAPTPRATPADPATAGLPASPTTFSPVFNTTQAAGGQVVTADGRAPIVVDGEPITARTDVDVTPADPSLEVHGYLITSLASVDQTNVDTAFGKAVIDLTANEPARETNGVVFPSTLAGTAVIASAQGARQYVNVAVTQFIDDPANPTAGVGTVRRFTSVGGSALYAPKTNTDGIAPTIASAVATTNGGGVRFDVAAADAGGIVRVVVMYRDGATWRSIDLGQSGTAGANTTFAASAATTNTAIDYFVQVVDGAGNVSVSSNKATLFRASPGATNLAPTAGLGSARQVPTGSVAIAGTYSDPDGPAPLSGRIDLGAGAGFQPLTLVAGSAGSGTFTTTANYPTAGTRTVTAEICDNGGACGRVSTTITAVAPTGPPNQAPKVSAGSPLVGFTGSANLVKITYSDADGPAPITMTVDDGKGSGPQAVSPVPASGSSRSITYPFPGSYTVAVKVCDGAGACATSTTAVLVISALGAAGKVVPILDCIKVTGSKLTAKWGYRNTSTGPVNLPVGLGNFFLLTPFAQGQPTTFVVGERHNVFTTTTTGLGAVWVLNGRVAAAFRYSTLPSGVTTCK